MAHLTTRTPRAQAAALAALVIAVSFSTGCSAEIPHENYDLAASDLEMVVALLNASVRASEDALSAMADEDLQSSAESLDLIDGALSPATALVDDLVGVADSYDDLSALLPPFVDLHDGMAEFNDDEAAMLEVWNLVATMSRLEDMTDEQANETLRAASEMLSLISSMRATAGSILASAQRIDGLEVDGVAAFVPNDLVELVGELVAFLDLMEQRLEDALADEMPWDEGVSYLILWIQGTTVFVGEDLVGGGYIYLDPTSAVGLEVSISIDGTERLDETTGLTGGFSFAFPVPAEEAWLGEHSIAAHAETPLGGLASETLVFTVTLIPTQTTLELSSTELSPNETLLVTVLVEEEEGDPLTGVSCTLTVDSASLELVTDPDGRAESTLDAVGLGLGPHYLSAAYAGGMPYAPSASETVYVSVTVHTALDLTLSSDRLQKGEYLLGRCELSSDREEPMAWETVTMTIDGLFVDNHTTEEDGSFAFSYRDEGLGAGSHLVTVTYTSNSPGLRNCSDSEVFTIIELEKRPYPFLPWIPGWGGGLSESVPDLFFGDNAYYAWLLILLVAGLTARAMRARRARAEAKASRQGAGGASYGLPGGPAPPAKSLSRAEAPGNPYDDIVWHYGRLVAFLRGKKRMALAESMTHWEIARLLLSTGYPRAATNSVTTIFERAFYSGSGVSAEEADRMRSSVKEIIEHAGGA